MTAQEYLNRKGLEIEDGYIKDLATDTGDYLTQEKVCVMMEQYAKQRQEVVPHDTVVSLPEHVFEEIKFLCNMIIDSGSSHSIEKNSAKAILKNLKGSH